MSLLRINDRVVINTKYVRRVCRTIGADGQSTIGIGMQRGNTFIVSDEDAEALRHALRGIPDMRHETGGLTLP
jgi:hypothetical protein